MKSDFSKSLAISVLITVTGFAGAQSYQFDGTTHYQFGGSDIIGTTANPDTGFMTITNDGTSTFNGLIGLENVGGAHLNSGFIGPFAPGDSVTLASGPEGSNQGGFGPDGLLISMVGTVNGTEAVNLKIFDGDVHSGVPRLSPCDQMVSDSFVLQGGSPTGCDNGDPYETTQADGHWQWKSQAVPEPASFAILGLGIGAFLLIRRK